MIALLDVHVLLALVDPTHVHHEAAHGWFGAHREEGWATCPVTENGLVRAVSHPTYPGRRTTVAGAVDALCALANADDHHFWPDSASLRRTSRIDVGLLGSHERITSAYLLLLAVEYEGRLVTVDRELPLAAVPRAKGEQLLVLG